MKLQICFGILLMTMAACGEDLLFEYEAPDIPAPIVPPPPLKPTTPPPPSAPPARPTPPSSDPCIEEQTAFDIEEVSVLEDAFALPSLRDAIVLDNRVQGLGSEDSWRVSSVDVLVMIANSHFGFYPDDMELTIEVFDADNPDNSNPFRKTQKLRKSDLSWELITLRNPATAVDRQQKRAWWKFDFADVIPESGMNAERYIVGIKWSGNGEPTVGYSNYNRACSRNWTNSGRGFINNGINHPVNDNECSWPMLRVQIETRSYGEVECD